MSIIGFGFFWLALGLNYPFDLIEDHDWKSHRSHWTGVIRPPELPLAKSSNLNRTLTRNPIRCEGFDDSWLKVRTPEDLLLLKLYSNWLRKVVLCNDIDFQGQVIDPIPVFGGTLDGLNHEIKNLNIIRPRGFTGNSAEGRSGLFDFLWGANIKNLKLKNFKIEGFINAGALAATAVLVELQNIQAESIHVLAGALSGGLVGVFDLSRATEVLIKNSQVTSFELAGAAFGAVLKAELDQIRSVDNRVETGYAGGGIFGYNEYSDLRGCQVTAVITPVNPMDVSIVSQTTGFNPRKGDSLGGLGGIQDFATIPDYQEEAPKVSDCRVQAKISGDKEVGGAYGSSTGDDGSMFEINRSEFKVQIEAQSKAGGLVGSARYASISGVEIDADVEAKSEAGGLFGYADFLNSVSNTRIKANVFSKTRTGGLVGLLRARDTGTIHGNLPLSVYDSLIYEGMADDAFVGRFQSSFSFARVYLYRALFNDLYFDSIFQNDPGSGFDPNWSDDTLREFWIDSIPFGSLGIWKQLEGQIPELRIFESDAYDLNGDGLIQYTDLQILLERLGLQSSVQSYGNLNNDSIIDKVDVSLFLRRLRNH